MSIAFAALVVLTVATAARVQSTVILVTARRDLHPRFYEPCGNLTLRGGW